MRKPILAGTVGHFVEQFDYGIYGYLAPFMAVSFFPPGDSTAALLGVYAGFAVSFLVRPIGGLVFGRYGDRIGRRNVLAIAIVGMGVFTALIGVLPTYAQIGVASTVLLLVIRLLQGLVQGGEYAGAVAFIYEYSERRRRGFNVSFVSISAFAGLLCGAGLAALMTALLTSAQMQAWGWRVPFLVALPLSAVGLFIRLRVGETPAFRRLQEDTGADGPAPDPLRRLRTQWKPIALFTGFAITNAVLSYTWVTFLPGYLQTSGGIGKGAALLTNVIAVAVLLPLLAVSGTMVDRFGRRRMLVAACVVSLVAVPSAFGLVLQHTFAAALVAQLIYAIPVALIAVALTVTMAELFPTGVRYSASALGYNIAFGVFGGTAPLVATALTAGTGSIWPVAAYVCVVALVSLSCIVFGLRETAEVDESGHRVWSVAPSRRAVRVPA